MNVVDGAGNLLTGKEIVAPFKDNGISFKDHIQATADELKDLGR